MKDQDSDYVGQFTRISQLLRKVGHKPGEAVELTELIFSMASANVLDRIDASNDRLNSKMDLNNDRLNSKIDLITVRLESKMDVQNSKIDAQNTKYNVVILLLGLLTATGVLGFLSNIFNWGA